MDLNQENIKKIMGLVTFSILLFVGAQNLSSLWLAAQWFIKLLTPFLVGLSIAFILNVLMRGIEQLLSFIIKAPKGKKEPLLIKRSLAILFSLFIIFGISFILLFLIVPEFNRTFVLVIDTLPVFAENAELWFANVLSSLPVDINELPTVELDWVSIREKVSQFLGQGGYAVFNTTIGVTTSILSALINLLLGLVFAIYILLQKENLGRQFERLLKAFIQPTKVEAVLKVLRLSDSIFSKFVAGQFFEAVLIGVLCFVGMLIFKMPYALVISSLVAVTALIPIFGAFFGTAAGVFLILIVNPMQALWFIVFIIVLQQIEGNMIYPKLVGNSIGLPGIWVLASVTIGGSAFGIPGMLIGVPLTSVMYSLLREEVNKRIGIESPKNKRVRSKH